MNLNLTLLGEFITFIIFIAFVMKWVWPPLMKAMEARRQKIADGLAAAEQGQKELELAHHKSREQIAEAKHQASIIIEDANLRASHIIEESKKQARVEGDRLLKLAQGEIEQERNKAHDLLMAQVAHVAVAGAEKILQREVDKSGNEQLVNEVLSEM